MSAKWKIDRWKFDNSLAPLELARQILSNYGRETNIVAFEYGKLRGEVEFNIGNRDFFSIRWPGCLLLSFDSDKRRGSISELYGRNCRKHIDENARGMLLLDMSLEIFCKFNIDVVTLQDESRIECEDQIDKYGLEPEFPLWLHHLILHGKTWYEGLGFKTEKEFSRRKDAIDALQTLKLEEIDECLSESLRTFQRDNGYSKRDTVRSLLSDLSKEKKKNCKLISELLECVTERLKKDPYADLYYDVIERMRHRVALKKPCLYFQRSGKKEFRLSSKET